MSETPQHDPHLFSAELHFALLNEGLRGPAMRRLMRTARKDTELWRIFETKVGEFRQYLRSIRKPTLVNLPLRAWEWLSDNARFTPTKEVVVTLFYVAVVMMGIEVFKSEIPKNIPEGNHLNQPAIALALAHGSFPPNNSEQASSAIGRIDRWMVDELRKAAESPEWRDALTKQLSESFKTIDLGPMLSEKLEATIRSPQFASQIHTLVDQRIAEQIDTHSKDSELLQKSLTTPPQVEPDSDDSKPQSTSTSDKGDASKSRTSASAPSPTKLAKGRAPR
jgi:hypothetical protein